MKSTPSSATSCCPTSEALRAIECAERVAGLDSAMSAVKDHQSLVDRRQHSRGGVLTRLEDITYSVLREYELSGVAA
jgi:hypothetical protein